FVELLDRVPVEHVLASYISNRLGPALLADEVSESLRAKRAVEQPLESLAPHLAAFPAADAPKIHFEVDPVVTRGQIADPARPPVVPAAMLGPTGAADCFFERRFSRMTRAQRSPKTPRSLRTGVNPGKR